MKFWEAFNSVRRRMGFVAPFFFEGDAEWLAAECVKKHKKVFDELARS